MVASPLLSRAGLMREASISAAINAAFSALFMVLIFGQRMSVPTRGADGLVGDALPQSFAIALMASLVPVLLLNRRLAGGRLGKRKILLRSVLIASVTAAFAIGLAWLLLPPGHVAFRTAAPLKILYGAALGAGVTTFSLRRWTRPEAEDRTPA